MRRVVAGAAFAALALAALSIGALHGLIRALESIEQPDLRDWENEEE